MELLYLYGIVREAHRLPTALEARLQAVSHRGLSALVEPVDSGEFSPEVLDDKLQSLEWVAARAKEHQEVLERVMRDGPIVPARLCTMFSAATAVQARLCEHEPRFRALLDAVDGREEWSVKVFCHRAALEREVAAREGIDHPEDAPATPGRAYLYKKRRQAELMRFVDDVVDDCVDEVLEHVDAVATDTRLRPLLSEQTTGRSDSMVINVAVLLDRGNEETLARMLDETSEYYGEHFRIERSGPWPAYSFCGESEDDPAEDDEEGLHAGVR